MPQYGYQGPRIQIPPVTKNLLIINVIFYVVTLLRENFMIGNFALFFPSSPFFRIWQPLTHMFMHGGFWHLFFNMYTLFIFGMVLENAIGSKKFIVYYFVTGLGAALTHMGVQWIQASSYLASNNLAAYNVLLGTPTLGASGAVYGILIGYAMLYPDSVLTLVFPPISLKAKWFVLIFAGIELVTGVFATADGVAHFAHLGGLMFGFLLMLYWKKKRRLFNQNTWF